MTELVIESVIEESVIDIEGGPSLVTSVTETEQTIVQETPDPILIDLNSGPRGEPGAAILTGPHPPNPNVGVMGDMYIVTQGTVLVGQVFKKTSPATWTDEGNVRGPAGGVNTVNGYTGPDVILVKADLGLGNVDNTTDLLKPISTATQTALNLKAPIDSPTFTGTVSGITKTMVGLSNVDNTADTAKPVSTAQQTALNLKANLASPTFTGTVSGITATMVGLGNVANAAQVDLTTAQTIAGIKTFSSAPVVPDNSWTIGKTNGLQAALDLKAPLASPTFTGTVSGITKAMVGLANVDNTTDLAKPISTATVNEFAYKQSLIDQRIKYNDWTQFGNPFNGGRRLYQSEHHNGLHKADQRWIVTGKRYNKSTNAEVGTLTATEVATFFNGDYDGGYQIPLGQYLLLTISFANEPGGQTSWYPYGDYFVSHYYSDRSVSQSLRVFTNFAGHGGPAWKTISPTTVVDAPTNQVVKFNNQNYQLTTMEFRFDAPDTGNAATITQIDWNPERQGALEGSVVDKYRINHLYSDLRWKSGGTVNASITPAGVITGTSFVGNGASLTALNGSNISTGTVADARLSSNVATLTGTQTITGAKTFTESLSLTKSIGGVTSFVLNNPDTTATSYTTQTYLNLFVGGDNMGGLKATNTALTGLSTKALFLTTVGAHPIAFGTGNTPTPHMVIMPTTGRVGIGNQAPSEMLDVTGNVRATTFIGSGASLTALNATNISTGTLADARLSANIFTTNTAQTVTAATTFTGIVIVPLPTADTHAAHKKYVDDRVAALVNGAGSTLDTLNELAAALGNDPNFATTVTNEIAGKEAVITAGTIAQYFRGDKTWQTLDKTAVGLANVANAAQVDLTSAQTIAGVKTFSSAPVVPDASWAIAKTSGLQAALDLKAPLASPTFTGTVTGTFSGNGASLTSLNGTNISTGTVADARLSTNVALLTGAQTFSGAKTFSSEIIGPATGNVLKVGDDARLADINISHVMGIVSQSDPNQGGVMFGSTAGNFRITGQGTAGIITGSLTITGAVTLSSTITGNGSGLTSLNANNLSTGTVPNVALPSRIQEKAQSIVDWNSAIHNGWYNATDAANAPAPGWYIGLVSTHDNGSTNLWVTQKVWAFNDSTPTDSNCWERRSMAGTPATWSSWRRVRYLEPELDARYTTLGTNQTISGTKTFSSAPVVPLNAFDIDKISGLQTALNGKEPTIGAGTSAQYFRGDKIWATLDKAAVGLGNVVNSVAVDLTTTQSIGGAKTFTSALTVATPTATGHATTKAYVDGMAVALTGNQTVAGIKTFSSAPTFSAGFNIPGTQAAIFDATGVGAPTYTTRSAGTKVVLFNSISASTVDYAIGVEGSNVWYSSGTTAGGHKWYTGTTNTMTLTSAGTLTATLFSGSGASLTALNAGNLSSGSVNPLRLPSTVHRVVHGSNASVARPTGMTFVEWVGSVAPTNALSDDTWVNIA